MRRTRAGKRKKRRPRAVIQWLAPRRSLAEETGAFKTCVPRFANATCPAKRLARAMDSPYAVRFPGSVAGSERLLAFRWRELRGADIPVDVRSRHEDNSHSRPSDETMGLRSGRRPRSTHRPKAGGGAPGGAYITSRARGYRTNRRDHGPAPRRLQCIAKHKGGSGQGWPAGMKRATIPHSDMKFQSI